VLSSTNLNLCYAQIANKGTCTSRKRHETKLLQTSHPIIHQLSHSIFTELQYKFQWHGIYTSITIRPAAETAVVGHRRQWYEHEMVPDWTGRQTSAWQPSRSLDHRMQQLTTDASLPTFTQHIITVKGLHSPQWNACANNATKIQN